MWYPQNHYIRPREHLHIADNKGTWQHIWIWKHQLTVCHHRTDDQSKIYCKAVWQCVQYFVQYHRTTGKHYIPPPSCHTTKTIMLPLRYHYSRHPAGITLRTEGFHQPKNSSPWLKDNSRRWKVFWPSWTNTSERRRIQSNNSSTRDSTTLQWEVGDKGWLSNKKVSTKHPSTQMNCRWLGQFKIYQKISTFVYKLKLPLSMEAFHLVFHVSVIQKHKLASITGRCQLIPKNVEVNRQE